MSALLIFLSVHVDQRLQEGHTRASSEKHDRARRKSDVELVKLHNEKKGGKNGFLWGGNAIPTGKIIEGKKV